MKKLEEKLSERIEQLITLADKTISNKNPSNLSLVDIELFNELRASSLSFVTKVYGQNHSFYSDINSRVKTHYYSDALHCRGILKAIKSEIDEGWLSSVKGLLSAEIFTNFIDMAEHLLSEGYKDPAAVIIGGVLEEHLRQLCIKSDIPIQEEKGGKIKFKKADFLNNELGSIGFYNKLDQKNITAWLDLRNKAAHGKFNEYNKEQVEQMMIAVTEFLSRHVI